jgi:periplasmic divalent cation tolerance protein
MGYRSTIIIFITASSSEEAENIAKLLVEEKLVACVNIIPQIKSIYWWEGKICTDEEVMLIAKTKQSLFTAVMDRVKSLHSYEVPEIISFPISEGSPEYLNWIVKVTAS